MFHHGKAGHKLPLGKAEDRNGNYTVRLVKAHDGDVLIGTSYFSQSNRFANDVFGLIAEDVLRGVSIGFDPLSDEGAVERLGSSPVLERDALHFKGWKLLEYSHTPIGVNRDALTVCVQKAMDGSRKLHPQLLAMLTPYSQARRTVVPVAAPTVRKAMPQPMPPDDDDDQDGDPTAAGDDYGDTGGGAGAGDDDAGGTGGFDPTTDAPSDDPALPANQDPYAQPNDDEMPPTVQTLTDGAQGLLDLCKAIEGGMKKSEHMKGRKYAAKICADLRKMASEVSGFADKIHGELSGAALDPNAADVPDDDGDGDVPGSDEEESAGADAAGAGRCHDRRARTPEGARTREQRTAPRHGQPAHGHRSGQPPRELTFSP